MTSNVPIQQAGIHQPNTGRILATLGQPRLGPYRDFFQCTTDEQLLGAYFWGQAVSSAFQPTLGMYEVVLRNAIHRAASSYSSLGTSTSHPWYDKSRGDALVRAEGKTWMKVEEVLSTGRPPMRQEPQPSPDKVIASLSFGFWPIFLSGLAKRAQAQILVEVFPKHPHSTLRHWGVRSNVTSLIDTLKGIQALRNAVSHYEPIWKRHRLKSTEKHWSHSVVSLREKHEQILDVMAWCCPDAADAVRYSYASRTFKSICSTDAVKAFMADPFAAGAMKVFNPQNEVAAAA
jgi:hypothetical protein